MALSVWEWALLQRVPSGSYAVVARFAGGQLGQRALDSRTASGSGSVAALACVYQLTQAFEDRELSAF